MEYQSLWYDELCTIYYSNPELDFSTFIKNVSYEDVHPPLHYILVKFVFQFFGQSAFTLRIISVIFGVLLVFVMYLIGRLVKNHQLGLTSAALTASNYFLIIYSQEGRSYSLLVLLTSVSFLFLIKYYKNRKLKDLLFYTITVTALCYTHYYAFFTCFAQVVLVILLTFPKTNKERISFLKPWILSWLSVFILYTPWLSYFLKIASLEEFWIHSLSPTFFINYFIFYFGDFTLVYTINFLLIGVFSIWSIIKVISWFKQRGKFNSEILLILVTFSWVILTLLPPVIKSVTSLPIIFPRYTIIVVPGILLALAFTIELIPLKKIKNALLLLIVLSSSYHILFISDYYTAFSKTDFKGMTQWINEKNDENYPIINPY
ncbi:MAG: glycosyltransferase family 39 protein, partial [Polaribacter sp.]